MRILAVTPYYLPEGGGLERYAHEMLRRLARDHEVRALSFTKQGHGHTLYDGVDIRRHRARHVVGNTPVDHRFASLAEQEIASTRPDVVVAHTPVPFAAEAASRAARRQGVPFVLTYHAGRLSGSSPPLQLAAAAVRRTVEQKMIARSDALIAVSPFVRDHALAKRRDDVAVIPPGVDPRRFCPAREEPEPEEILFVGPLDRSYRWKGVDVLWEAFQVVRRHHPHARLTLVGRGDRVHAFQKRAARDPQVKIVPGASDEELLRHIQKCTLLCLPSTSDAESFGMVLAEANACARPVVASRIGGIPTHIRDGHNGLLAQPGDAWDLARCILRLFGDPEAARRMGRAGRTAVLRNHDWNALSAATARVLQQVDA